MAILCGDIHLSLRPPLFRSTEANWLETQAGYLDQLTNLADKFHVPVICSGDIFDRWNAPAELINFALKHLPHCFAIPGQHDLPYHRFDDIRRSAFWTLTEAYKITLLHPKAPVEVRTIRMWGFPWGCEVKPLENPHDLYVEVAVIHSYIWSKGTGYPGAPKEKRIKSWKPLLEGYDVALFGDNHTPLDYSQEGFSIFNPGTFMRRKKDEWKVKPSVGLLLSDGRVKRHYLDVERDCCLIGDEGSSIAASTLDFIHDLTSLGEDPSLNFSEAVSRYLSDNKVSEGARQMILEALEKANGSD